MANNMVSHLKFMIEVNRIRSTIPHSLQIIASFPDITVNIPDHNPFNVVIKGVNRDVLSKDSYTSDDRGQDSMVRVELVRKPNDNIRYATIYILDLDEVTPIELVVKGSNRKILLKRSFAAGEVSSQPAPDLTHLTDLCRSCAQRISAQRALGFAEGSSNPAISEGGEAGSTDDPSDRYLASQYPPIDPDLPFGGAGQSGGPYFLPPPQEESMDEGNFQEGLADAEEPGQQEIYRWRNYDE